MRAIFRLLGFLGTILPMTVCMAMCMTVYVAAYAVVCESGGSALAAQEGGGGGDRAGNGGGAAEQNFQFAYLKLQWVFDACLSSSNCITGEDVRLLRQIRDALSRELPSEKALRFESGAKNPSRFVIDGAPRVAVTGDKVGDPIYINLDLIYFDGASGQTEPADVGMAIAVLTHELGHHQGKFQGHDAERRLDLLGARVRGYAAFEMEQLKTDTWGEIPEHLGTRISMLAVHSNETGHTSPLEGAATSLLLSDGAGSYSLDASILSQLACPKRQNESGKLLGYRFRTMRWKSWRYAPGRTDFTRIYPFRASAVIFCYYPSDREFPTIYTDLDVVLELTFVEPPLPNPIPFFRFVPESVKVTLSPAKSECVSETGREH